MGSQCAAMICERVELNQGKLQNSFPQQKISIRCARVWKIMSRRLTTWDPSWQSFQGASA